MNSSKKTTATHSVLLKWRNAFAPELKLVDKVIIDLTKSETSLIPQVVGHIVSSGGKRLRPILTILSSKLCGYSGERHIKLAAAIEFLHTATLLHDDVVDESDLRRGNETANYIWGNAASVLIGDFLLGKAFQVMAQDGSIEVLQILSDASAIITEGEVKQLTVANDISIDKKTYINIISYKTAQLFSAACHVGAVISAETINKNFTNEAKALQDFGLNLGIAFQIADDALDYSAKQEELGKTIGDDFREGKVTLPVILAYEKSNNIEKEFWKKVIEGEKNEDDLAKAISLIYKHNALKNTIEHAKFYADKAEKALSIFPKSNDKNALIDLLQFSVNRPY